MHKLSHCKTTRGFLEFRERRDPCIDPSLQGITKKEAIPVEVSCTEVIRSSQSQIRYGRKHRAYHPFKESTRMSFLALLPGKLSSIPETNFEP